MRRTLLAVALGGAALVGLAPTAAQANHYCDPSIQLVCYALCPSPKICVWP